MQLAAGHALGGPASVIDFLPSLCSSADQPSELWSLSGNPLQNGYPHGPTFIIAHSLHYGRQFQKNQQINEKIKTFCALKFLELFPGRLRIHFLEENLQVAQNWWSRCQKKALVYFAEKALLWAFQFFPQWKQRTPLAMPAEFSRWILRSCTNR